MTIRETKRASMYKQIEQHGRDLQAIFPATADLDPVALCKKLHRLETRAHRAATDYCNGVIDPTTWEVETAAVEKSLDKLLRYRAAGVPVFINGDPRGYALKIRDNYTREHGLPILTDWGGFGLLAPDFSN